MFPWKTILSHTKESKRPVYLQLTDQFIKEITAGRIKPGTKIPGSRALATLLTLNRKTIIQAFDELIAQGWLEVRSSSGTYVTRQLPVSNYHSLSHDPLPNDPQGLRIRHYNFIESYSVLPKHAIYVNGGSPDPRIAPIDWIYRESRSLIKSRTGYRFLHYGDIKGNETLRETLTDYLANSRGMHIGAENIVITRGSQMGIFLALKGLVKEGGCVVTGEPGYEEVEWTVQFHDATLLKVPVDDEGIRVDLLEQICMDHCIELVYVTPHHHFPTTVILSNTRRMKLLELALRYNFYILEDDYDYDFHYNSSPLLPLASIDRNNRVVYIGSFSKVFAPNVRVGYLVAAPHVIEELSKIRRIIDRQGDHIMERVVAESITSGELTRHLKKSLRIYRKRRDHLINLLNTHLAKYVHFTIPEGGMALWIKFNTILLINLQPYLQKQGLFLDINPDLAKSYNAVRFGFAAFNEDELGTIVKMIEEGIRQLSSSTSSSILQPKP